MKTEPEGRTALHMAAEYGHTDVVSLLLRAGADANARDNVRGLTPAYSAASRKHVNVLKILLPYVNVSDSSDTGVTALHVAAYSGDVETVRLLMEFGADIWAQDNLGRTPLDTVAKDTTKIGVMQILLAKATGQPLSDFEWHHGREELCHEVTRQYPKNIAFRNMLAALYINAQQYSSAATEFDMVLELQNPSNIKASIEEVIHNTVYCDICQVEPIMGLRHKCLVCHDYDLCHKCFQLEPHPDSPDHKYLTIPSQQWIQKRVQGVIVQ
jgi:hypothetical protein